MKGVIYLQNRFLIFVLVFCCSLLTHALNTSTSSTMTCLPHQSSALLRLKHEFALKKLNFTSQFSIYGLPSVTSSPKMKLWKAGTDCCQWDGVACNMETGQVVELDLSSSGLQGPLHPNSSLFNFRQLRRLNLAFNNFTFAQIPSTFGRLSRLTHLNLSHSLFSGRIPTEIAWLTNMVSLDLSSYMVSLDRGLLYLRMTTLAQNMTNLRELHLDGVNLSSSLPQFLANLSSLTSLSLSACNLHGEFPQDIFRLPNIKFIDASDNTYLNGFLPEFPSNTSLQSLILQSTNFSYKLLPDSIGNLKSLRVLDLCNCNFSGVVPSSVGNLFKLTTLYLSGNNFKGQLPSTLGNLSQLTTLYLSYNNFEGQLPSMLGNLSQLTDLDLSYNNFNCQLPFTFGNLSQLTTLYLSGNNFNGQLPSTLGNLFQLTSLGLSSNNFNGQLPSTLGNLFQLTTLDLSGNNFNGRFPPTLGNLAQLTSMYLSHNNFNGQLPSRLGNLSQLTFLVLSRNNFNSQLPSTLGNLSQLIALDLSYNNFSGSLDLNMVGQGRVRKLYLSDNRDLSIKITGVDSTLPKFSDLFISSCDIGKKFPDFLRTQDELEGLDISNNKIEGKIPSWFFNVGIDTLYFLNLSHNSFTNWERDPNMFLPWKNLQILDLRSNMFQGPLAVPPSSTKYFFVSKNKMTGRVHSFFCNLSELIVLDVSNNLLTGMIPRCLGSNGNYLQTLDLSHNKLQGQVPESLINCRALQVLNLGHNQIYDVFPLWLQNLPELQVLVLRSNKFYGPIWHPQKFFGFLKLRILDLSFNNFDGNLSPDFFRNWSAINVNIHTSNKSKLRYMKDDNHYYRDSVSLVVKGLEIEYVKILTVFTSLDLSNNNFHGEIPRTVGELKSLIVLNLSSNNFKGLIPSSLGSLTELESLDLSNNKLSGRIPQELASLFFLEYLNLSDNKLTGPIPQSRQFDKFLNSSFVGNLDLCGSPLPKKCQIATETPIPDHNQESKSDNGFGWKAVVLGYVCGFLVGAIGGHVLFSRKPNLFMRIYGTKM